jgi:NAD(P)-dependent dehydrogenase (short-subunit alcohol dehydrogenase family)
MGASSVIGRAVTLRLALAGAELALTTATSDAEEAFEVQRLGRSLATQGKQAFTEALDLSSGANVQVAVRQVAKALGGLDTVIVLSDQRQERATQRLGDADWSKLIGANLGAVFFVARAAYREFASREPDAVGVRGRIIAVQREPAERDGAVYKATKIAALALVQALREEWQEDGIAVSLLSVPGSEEDRVVARATETIVALLDAPQSASGVHRVEP